MFAVGVRYLTGRAVAAAQGVREAAEWPPHPARIFMAMVAAHFETGGGSEERGALEWLESLTPGPSLYASAADKRSSVTRFVPVNDRAVPDKPMPALQSAQGLTRQRAARTFVSVRPYDDRVFLIWNDDCPDRHRPPLEALCSKVTRIGHSSSLVQVWVEDAPPPPTWVPVDGGAEAHFRTLAPGLLEHLEAEYEADPTRLPRVSTWAGYAQPPDDPGRATPGSIWSPGLIVLRLEGTETSFRHLDVVSILRITRALHGAVLDRADEPISEVVSGHQADGSPSALPHLAYLPLPFVSHRHADGLLRGLAVAVPRDLSGAERWQVLEAVSAPDELWMGRLGRWALVPEDRDPLPDTLDPRSWTAYPRGAIRWGTVTPVSFDRHPKADDDREYEAQVVEMMQKACRRVGLPEPATVLPLPVSPHLGVPPSHAFPRLARKGGGKRRHLHAIIVFSEPILGPVSIGAGRFRGYGLMRPLRQGIA